MSEFRHVGRLLLVDCRHTKCQVLKNRLFKLYTGPVAESRQSVGSYYYGSAGDVLAQVFLVQWLC